MIRFDDDDFDLRRRNSIEKHRRRRIEKNRFPKKCKCAVCGERFTCRSIEDYVRRQYYLGPDKNGKPRFVCGDCSAENKITAAAKKLYRLVCAVPVAQRDRNEIYPNDFRYPRIPLWHEDKARMPGLGLRDYAGPSKFGIRQHAASSVQDVLSHLIGLPAIETRWALYLSAYSPETQQTLKRLGRIYRDNTWFPTIRGIPFSHARSAYLYPEHVPPPELLHSRVVRLQPPDYAELKATQESYNAKHGSYWNSTSINYRGRVDRFDDQNWVGQFKVPSERLREQRSLNIPQENIEARKKVVANIERDFAPKERREAA